jgi:hypothetical protein
MQPPNDFDMEARAEEHLAKAVNFQRMGLMNSAEHELQLARQLNPLIVSDARYQAFHTQKNEQRTENEAWKIPMRVGAAIAVLDGLVFAVIWVLALSSPSTDNAGQLFVWGLVHFGVDIYLVIALLQLKDTARRVAIWWALVCGLVGVISIFMQSWLDLVMQVSLCGVLLLLFLGKPSTLRTIFGGALFLIGYVGSFCALFAFSFLNALH